MGNIVRKLNICGAARNFFVGQYHFPTPTRSQTMRKAVGVWQKRNIIQDKDRLRKNRFKRKREAKFKDPFKCCLRRKIKRQKRRKKYKLLRKHLKAALKSKNQRQQPLPSMERIENHERTASQQALYEHRKALDLRDPMLTKYRVAARDSPSSRCTRWVQNMPHASLWDKQHTLSGTQIVKKRKKHKRKRRKHHRRLEEKHSQRSLLMKKLMSDKLRYLYASAGRKEEEEEEETTTEDKNPKISRRSKVKLKRKHEKYDSDDKQSDSTSKKHAIRKILRSYAQKNTPMSSGKIGRKNRIKKERYKHLKKRHNKLDHRLVRQEERASRKKRKRNKDVFSNHTCLGIISPQQRCMEKAARRRTEKKDKKYKKMKRKLSKIQSWLKEKTKERPRVRFAKNIYLRKHRHGQYITRQQKKPSLGWAILQSIKLLERKKIPYPLAILKYVHKKWGLQHVTLVQLNDALKTMAKKGILTSEVLRENETVKYTVSKQKKKAKKRAVKWDTGDRDLERGDKVDGKGGFPRVTFQHGQDNLTSIKCRRYGSQRTKLPEI